MIHSKFLFSFLTLVSITLSNCSGQITYQSSRSSNCNLDLNILGENIGNEIHNIHLVFGSTFKDNKIPEITELFFKMSNQSKIKYKDVVVSIKYNVRNGSVSHDSLVVINDSLKDYMSRDISDLKTVNYRFEYISNSFDIFFIDKLTFTNSPNIDEFTIEDIDSVEILISSKNQMCKSLSFSICRIKAPNGEYLIEKYLSELVNHLSINELLSTKVIFNHSTQKEIKGFMHDYIHQDSTKIYEYQNDKIKFERVN